MLIDSILSLDKLVRKGIPGWDFLKQNLAPDIEMILSVVCIRLAMCFMIPPQTDAALIRLVEHKITPI